ncbi:DUF6207 family protein [Streptomyces sp. NPDC058299]|uniref:DUF6207 family protein n=1 Tax=unclassified Streptomyces TaxID=2593676 RepID=UPI0036E9224A
MPSSSCSPTGGRRRAAEHTTRNAGEPGVRLRCYLDLRQQLTYHGCGEISRGERREHPFTSVGSRKPASGEAKAPAVHSHGCAGVPSGSNPCGHRSCRNCQSPPKSATHR